MNCPICKNELEIKQKKVGENAAGEIIYNEFAICHNCKKQWNLDKQREKKKKLAKEALAEKTVEAGKAAEKPHKKRPADGRYRLRWIFFCMCYRSTVVCNEDESRQKSTAKEKEKTSGISGKHRKADRFFC